MTAEFARRPGKYCWLSHPAHMRYVTCAALKSTGSFEREQKKKHKNAPLPLTSEELCVVDVLV